MPESTPKLLTVDVADPEVFGFNAANTLLAVGERDGDSAVILDLAGGREVDRVGGIRFGTPDTLEFVGDRLLATRAGAVILHDPHRRVTDEVFRPDGLYALRVTAAPGGRLLAVGVNRGLILYDLDQRAVRWHLRTHIDNIPTRTAFSPGGRYVAADFRPERHGPSFLLVWDATAGQRWRTLELGPTDSPAVVAFRDDGPTVVVGQDGLTRYDLDRGDEPVTRYPRPGLPQAVTFRDDGRSLAATGYGDGLVVMDVTTGEVTWAMDRPGGRVVGYCVPSPDWSLVASTTDAGVLVWPSGLGG